MLNGSVAVFVLGSVEAKRKSAQHVPQFSECESSGVTYNTSAGARRVTYWFDRHRKSKSSTLSPHQPNSELNDKVVKRTDLGETLDKLL